MDTAKYNTTFNSALYDQSEGMFFTITGRFSANTDDASIFVDNVKVTDKMVSSDRAEFLNFSVPGQMGLSLINRDINRVALRVAPGTDLTSLTPTIELPAGAACSPSAGEAVDFTTPVTYTITNGGVVEEWTVTVDGSPAELVIDDTFDSTYGNADLNNWRYVGEVVNTFADDALGLNKAQKMPNPNGWAMDFQRTFDTAQSGTVLLESRLKVSALDAGLVIPQINGSGLDELAYTDGLASVKVNADGTLTLAGKTEMTVPGGTVTADTYFDLHILADTQTGRATAWIGEEMPADPEYVEMNFATRGIGNVAYTVPGSLTDGITLDYVRIVNTTPVSISATRVVTDGTGRSTYSTLRHSGETVLTASVKNRTGTAQRVSLIAALYDQAREGEETGDLSAVYMQAAEIPANAAEDVAVTVPLPDYATENSLQIFLWSDINKVEPLVYPIEKPVQTYQQLAPANIFSDGAVLQQGKPIKVFGKASDTTEVTVAFAGETRTVTPVNQEWSVEFPAQDATFEPQTMEISTAGDAYHPAEHRTISDILIGEVWMISGQSNVEYAGYGVTNPNVKMFDVQKLIDYSYADRNAREARDDISETWKPLSTSYSGSYIGIHYANLLQQKLNVPVGMIVCAFGGTPIASFMNPETLDDDPAFASLLNDYNSSLANPDMALTNGSPSVLYETMLSSVIGYPLSGVLWYQGENEMQIERYEKQITNMIADWRASWDCGDFPFYIVQLPRYDGNHYADWAAMRAMQYRVANSVPNCDIVCIIDLGEAQNIHPADKMPIAERLATLALATYYQTSPEKDAEYSGPRVQSATADGGTVTLAFTHTGSGLKSLNTNGTLTGFEIAGTDGTYYPAEATIDGETVVLTCTQVAQPATVRYAWTWFPEVSLGNAEGYPAFPFELAIAN